MEICFDIDRLPASVTKNSQIPEIRNLPISDLIKDRATEEFRNLIQEKTLRKKNRKKMIFCALYQAYRRQDIPIDPKEITEMLGIPNSKMSNYLNYCDFSVISQKKSPITFVDMYLRESNIDSFSWDQIFSFCSSILEKFDDVESYFPQKVALSLLLYYLEIHGINSCVLNWKSFSKSSLKGLLDRISEIHNS
jgi:hypothetical protein